MSRRRKSILRSLQGLTPTKIQTDNRMRVSLIPSLGEWGYQESLRMWVSKNIGFSSMSTYIHKVVIDCLLFMYHYIQTAFPLDPLLSRARFDVAFGFISSRKFHGITTGHIFQQQISLQKGNTSSKTPSTMNGIRGSSSSDSLQVGQPIM